MPDTERFCGNRFKYGTATCKRTPKHPGLHRNARTLRHSTVMWGDNEGTPEGQDKQTT